jgi:hypothetical protein
MTKEQFSKKMIDVTISINQVMEEFDPSKKKTLIQALTMLLIKQNLTYLEQLEFSDYVSKKIVEDKNKQIK